MRLVQRYIEKLKLYQREGYSLRAECEINQ